MQIMIDTAVETSVGLRRIAAMLAFTADQIDSDVPAGTIALTDHSAARIPLVPIITPLPPVSLEGALPDPAKIFGAQTMGQAVVRAEGAVASNVVPLRPVVPEVPLPPTQPATAAAPPNVPTTSPAPAGAPVELDGAGFPWDERIHSGTPTRNANGLWRMKRGVQPDVIQNVEAELRAIYPAPVKVVNVGQTTLTLAPAGAPAVPVPPGASATVPLPPNVPVPPAVAPTPPTAPVTLPGVPTPGGAVQAPIAPGVPSGNDAFRVMMDRFSKEMGANGRLNKTVMAPIFAALGVAGWQEFFKKPELIPNITAEAERLLA